MTYEGRAYKAPSGQWSWAIAEDGVDIVGALATTAKTKPWRPCTTNWRSTKTRPSVWGRCASP